MSAPHTDDMHSKLLDDDVTASRVMCAYRDSNPVDETFADMVRRVGPRPVYEVWSPRFYMDATEAGFHVYELDDDMDLISDLKWKFDYVKDMQPNALDRCCVKWWHYPVMGGDVHYKRYLVAETATPEEVVAHIPNVRQIWLKTTHDRLMRA